MKFLGCPLQVSGTVTCLVKLAGNLVQGTSKFGRYCPVGKLLEQRFDDWLGLFGVSRLEDCPAAQN